jgi:hypothetical protein
VHDFALQLDTLVYDTSTFFLYLASGNERSTLAQRGHSKQQRFDLRQISLALFVTREGQSPLYADVYEGTTVDALRFPVSLTAIRHRVEQLVGHLADLILVYDKGNNAQAQQALVDALQVHYVASLGPSQPPALTAIPTTAYTLIGSGPLAKLPLYRLSTDHMGSGADRGPVAQLHAEAGANPGAPPALAQTARRLAAVATALGETAQRTGAERLTWWIAHAALLHLETEVFGKRLLSTDPHTWSTEEMILAYHGQSRAEAVCRQLQDVDHLAVQPPYHWTDQKMRVHTFICLVALLLCRLVERECRSAGYQGSLSGLLDLLSTIRLALVLWSADTPKGHPRCPWLLEDCAAEAWQRYQRLAPPVPPFVYTSSATCPPRLP